MTQEEFAKYKKKFTKKEWNDLSEKKKKKVRFDSAYAILAASENPFGDFLKKHENNFFRNNKKKGFEYIGWGTSRNVMQSPNNVVYKFPNNLDGVIGNYLEAGLHKAGYEHISPCKIIYYKGIPVLEMDRVEDRSWEYEELIIGGMSDDLCLDDVPEWAYDQDGVQVGDHDFKGLVYFDLGYSYSLANDYNLIPGIKKAIDKFVPLVFPKQTFENLYKDGDDWSEHDFPVKLIKMAKKAKA